MSAILWCGFHSVVFGTSIPTLTDLGWNQISIRASEVVQRSHRPQTAVVGGVLESQCDQLFHSARKAT
jgi:tRNA(adenine34) deaminase